MNYEESLAYIEQLNTRGIALGLERMTMLMDLLGNPQEQIRCIHVAGTNGKGSVCAFMDSVLQQAGLCVGRYTSPTLYAYLERFQINGSYMEEAVFAQLLTQVRAACEIMAQHNQDLPTVFEVETAVAFLYFQQQQCDYVLLETGMGGRLDSTNIIKAPILSVITSVSMDHTALLGDNLRDIAGEKAGIIKPGSAVVIAPQEPEAMEVLLEKCSEYDITPVIADLAQLTCEAWSLQGQVFSYKNRKHISIALLGDYQRINAITAIEALGQLQGLEPSLTDAAIEAGILMARWPGRFELIGQKPLFIVDGAHNPAGAQALADTIKRIPKETYRKCWLLMGVFRDKEYRAIGSIVSDCGDTLICFQPPGDRGLKADILAEAMKAYYTEIVITQAAADAVQYVLEHAAEDDMIVSFGSLSTIQAVQTAANDWGCGK